MAFARLSLPFSLLLLSLLVIAFAGDYGSDLSSKYGFDGIPADSPQPKPEGEAKSKYGEKPSIYKLKSEEKPKGEVKPNYGTKPGIYKPKSQEKPGYDRKPEGEKKSNYGTKQYNYKPKEEDKEKLGYEKKSYVVKPKPEGEEKPNYGTKPEIYKPKSEEKPNYETKQYNYKPKSEEKNKSGYERKPYVVKPNPEGEEKPNYDTKSGFYKSKPEEKEKLLHLGVEGLVFCKSGSKYYPIQGALAKVTCQAVDEIGLEKTLPICSVPTDAKGYFFATVSSLSVVDKSLKLKYCKAFLESSPLETCNVPTNVNKGITGAPLSGVYRVLNHKHTNLYSVGPFFFTSEPKSIPNGY